MKQMKLIMGMPITVEIVGANNTKLFDDTFAFFHGVDNRYSTYKYDSEITRINNGLPRAAWSIEMKKILRLCEDTKQETNGFFDIKHGGTLDPSGLVKGWSIWEAAKRLKQCGIKNFCIEAGGDIQADGKNERGEAWTIGIRNPFDTREIIKTLRVSGKGVATSGTYIRGQHIYNPHDPHLMPAGVQSLTVVASNIYEADRFATAAFAMGKAGITFVEQKDGLEGYMVGDDGIAVYTSGFQRHIHV